MTTQTPEFQPNHLDDIYALTDPRESSQKCESCPHVDTDPHNPVQLAAEIEVAVKEWDAIPGTGTIPGTEDDDEPGYRLERLSPRKRAASLDLMDLWAGKYAHVGLSYQAHCGGAWAYKNDKWIRGH